MKKVSLSLNLWISFSKSRFFCSRNPLACLLFPMQFLSMKVNEPLHRDLPCPTKLIHAVAHLCQTALLFLSGVWQSKKTQSGVVWVAMAVPELSFLAVPLSWYSSREILCRLIEVWSLLLCVWPLSLPVRSLSLWRTISAIYCIVGRTDFVALVTEAPLEIKSPRSM